MLNATFMNIANLPLKAVVKQAAAAAYQKLARYRRGFVWMLSFVVAALVLGFYVFGVFARLELLSLDWRFNLRQSNTEPGILRLNIEAGKEDVLKEKIREMREMI